MFGSNQKKQIDELQEELFLQRQVREGLYEEMLALSLDNRGQITTANRLFEEELGFAKDSLRGRNIKDLVPTGLRNTEHFHRMIAAISEKKHWVGAWQIGNDQDQQFWLRTILHPVRSRAGELQHFVVYANNLTRTIESSKEYENLIKAMQRSMAVIEFDMSGHIIEANKLFLSAMGYTMEEIKGKHHRIFCEPAIYESPEYQTFWAKLNQGEFNAGRYCRVDKHGHEVWLEASYNPISNARGQLYKVVKFATVVTEQVLREREVAAAALVAFETSQGTDDSAKKGRQVMQETADVMRQLADQMTNAADNIRDLDKQSQLISSIIQSISGIAEQTNLLALNAAIEAARAGDQGRGFAVVADEVRQLASRTTEATEEIVNVVNQNQALTAKAVNVIDSGKSQAEAVLELVSQASAVIQEIQEGAQKVVDAVSQFSSQIST